MDLSQLLDEVSLALALDALVVVVVAVACPAARLHADGESRGAPPQGGPRLESQKFRALLSSELVGSKPRPKHIQTVEANESRGV